MSKRRRGFPSETRVKRGPRSVKGGEKELQERLGNNDPCPCGSGRRFQELLPEQRPLSTARVATTTSGSADALRGGKPPLFASVAQRTEHRASNPVVGGSNPLGGFTPRRLYQCGRSAAQTATPAKPTWPEVGIASDALRHRGRGARRAPAKRDTAVRVRPVSLEKAGPRPAFSTS
jgi:hypothetical protein